MGDVVEADEYLQPYKGLGNHDNQPCNATVYKSHLCVTQEVFKPAITDIFWPLVFSVCLQFSVWNMFMLLKLEMRNHALHLQDDPPDCTNTFYCFSSSSQNGRPVRENSIALRYITDPTHNSLDKEDFTGHGTHLCGQNIIQIKDRMIKNLNDEINEQKDKLST